MSTGNLLPALCSVDSMAFGESYNFPGEPALHREPPAGYRLTTRSRIIGYGRTDFERAAHAVLHWRVHYGSGFHPVAVPDEVSVGAVSQWRVTFGPLRPAVACRVFAVTNSAEVAGFGHGALTGHPQSGWESYLVTLDPDNEVRLTIRVVWRPATALMRLTGPAAPWVLNRVLTRNLRALEPLV